MKQLLALAETIWIRDRALEIGFDACGIAPAEKFPELNRYSEWLELGYAGEMNYLKDPRRFDPRNAMSGAHSLIVCALNYNSEFPYSTQRSENVDIESATRGWISRYAWGDDYHEVLWQKLNLLAEKIRAHFLQPLEVRAYADSGPIHERAAAKYAGLGWLGKNTLMINQSLGSWLFLGVMLTTLPLAPTLGAADAPPPDLCGTCRRCLDACPTQAIVEPYVLNANRCISYLTIEKRETIPEELREHIGVHIFGCDICQDVCPWNRKSPRTQLAEFQPRTIDLGREETAPWSLFQPDLLSVANLSEEQFREQFRGSPIKRTKWKGLVRNACIALGNAKVRPQSARYQEVIATLARLSHSEDTSIAESAQWALSRIQPASPGGHPDGSSA